MDISDLTQSVRTPAALASVAERVTLKRADNESRFTDDDKGRALDAFRNELRTSLRARFFSQFGAGVPGYAAAGAPADPRAVANEAIGAAQRVAAEAPTQAASSLITFRATVRDTATAVRESLSARDDTREIDDAVALVEQGLDSLDSDFAGVRESTASVLSVDSTVSERSTIRIRTQEGDYVKLDLRQRTSLSAADTLADEGRLTEIELDGSTRVRLKVEGDLNDDELAAIQNVIDQAATIADDFFGGDLGEAFNNASAFAFDSTQLDRVNLRFRFEAETSVRFATQTTPSALPPAAQNAAVRPTLVPAPDVTAPIRPSVVIPALPVVQPVAAPDVVAAPIASDEPAPATAAPAVSAEPVDDAGDAGPPLGSEYLDEFFNVLSDFLRSVSEGFGSGESETARFQFSESFKLTLLRETLTVAAPADQQNAGELAASAVNQVLDIVGIGEEEPTVA